MAQSRFVPTLADLGVSNHKVPPAWGPALDTRLPFREWKRLLLLWKATTDLDKEKIGPAVVSRLSGTAQEIGFELFAMQSSLAAASGISGSVLEYGDTMVLRGVHGNHSGLDILICKLEKDYAPLSQERQLKYISEFFRMTRVPQEDIDEFLARFELARNRAHSEGKLCEDTLRYVEEKAV